MVCVAPDMATTCVCVCVCVCVCMRERACYAHIELRPECHGTSCAARERRAHGVQQGGREGGREGAGREGVGREADRQPEIVHQMQSQHSPTWLTPNMSQETTAVGSPLMARLCASASSAARLGRKGACGGIHRGQVSVLLDVHRTCCRQKFRLQGVVHAAGAAEVWDAGGHTHARTLHSTKHTRYTTSSRLPADTLTPAPFTKHTHTRHTPHHRPSRTQRGPGVGASCATQVHSP